MDGVADNCLCHLLTRLNCRGHKGTFIFTYLGPTYELSIVKIADAVVNRNSLWGHRCLFQLSLPISSINMNKKLQPVRATFSGNSQCNKSSSCIGRAIFFFIFVLKIGRSSYKKTSIKGYDLPGVYTGDVKSYIKWVGHPGTTDFPQFSLCMRCV